MSSPRIAITLGDPSGIGPETIVAAWPEIIGRGLCRPFVAGHPEILRRAIALRNSPLKVLEISDPNDAIASVNSLPCITCLDDDACDVAPASVDPRGGRAAVMALEAATQWALDDRIDALCTAPLHKAAMWAAGYHYPGHTELLAKLCNVPEVAMMLYLPPGDRVFGRWGLGVVHVTLHVALRDIFSQLSITEIVSKARLADAVMRAIGASMSGEWRVASGEEEGNAKREDRAAAQNAPPPLPHSIPPEAPLPPLATRHSPLSTRLGLCALNPHAGEQGLFGDEEQTILAPAADAARAEGLQLAGPHAADTLMVRAAAGEFDAVVALYHDQGHIALKLLDMHRAVNVTLGLPIVRTSVAHGTAHDIAWQGRAGWQGMIEAVEVAARLAPFRHELWRA